jgi:hypothetical protein
MTQRSRTIVLVIVIISALVGMMAIVVGGMEYYSAEEFSQTYPDNSWVNVDSVFISQEWLDNYCSNTP